MLCVGKIDRRRKGTRNRQDQPRRTRNLIHRHFENEILVLKSSPSFFFFFSGYLTKEVNMSADTDLTDMFTFCLLAILGSEKSFSIVDF